MKRALAALILLAALVLATALATLIRSGNPAGPGGNPSSRPHTQPVRIGVSLGLTGRYAAVAAVQEKGFRLWARQQNAAGGLLGRPVELLVRDDASTPDTAVASYKTFISEDRVDFLFAPYSSELTQAVAGLAGEHGFPLITSGAATETLWDSSPPLLLALLAPATRYAQGFLELLLQNDITRLALLTFPGIFPEEVTRGTTSWAARLGLNVVLRRQLTGLPELAPALEEARAAGAEALLLYGYPREAEAGRRTLQAVGWRPRAMFATVGPSLDSYGENLGELAEGDFSASNWEPDLPYPGTAKFSRDFQREYRQPPSYHAASAFAAGQLLALAVTKIGSMERRRVAEALASLDTTTILGRFAVDQRGMQLRHFPVIIQWQDGRRVVVWPRDLATAKPRFPR